MTSFSDNPPPEALLAERDFVRALVRSLLRGADGEEDVVQRTMVRALTGPPPRGGRVRQWLGKVARNLARDQQRRAARRTVHERRAARAEALPSAADVVEREHQRRRVVDAVLRLADPYRTAVLLRYWEELPPRAIAERLGIPDATARSHVHRGLQMLRRLLDAEFGDRGRWIAALTPCAALSPAAPPTTGVILMSTKSKTLVTACCVVATGLAIYFGLPRHDDAALRDAPPGDPRPIVVGAGRDEPGNAGGAVADTKRQALVAGAEITVNGSVMGAGEVFADFELTLQWFQGPEAAGAPDRTAAVRTGPGGTFTWRGSPPDRLSTLRAITADPAVRLECEPQLVVPDQERVYLEVLGTPLGCRMSGVVTDPTGAPIGGAHVRVKAGPEVTTDRGGRYSLRVGRGDHSESVRAWAAGFAPRVESVRIPATADRFELNVQLLRGARITGRVLDEASEPIARARVTTSARMYHVETDELGRFELGSLDPATRHHVEVEKPGYLDTGQTFAAGTTDAQLVLRRGLEVAGRVLGPDGRGIPGAKIALNWQREFGGRRGCSDAGGSFRIAACGEGQCLVTASRPGFVTTRQSVTLVRDMPDLVIRLLPGHGIRGRVVDPDGAPVVGAFVAVMRGRGADAGMGPDSTHSGADGRFAIRDLSDRRPFAVGAAKVGFRRGVVEDVVAGAGDVLIRLERGASVAGRVVDGTTGRPIPVFDVQVDADPLALGHRSQTRVEGTDGYWTSRGRHYEPGQQLHVLIRAEGYAPHRGTAVAEVTPLGDANVIRMTRAASITGVVRDRDTRSPIANATLKLLAADADAGQVMPGRLPGATTDAEGRFEIGSLGPGVFKLLVRHSGYTDRFHGPIRVGSTPAAIRAEILLDHGAAVSGRIEGFDGLDLRAQILSYELPDCSQTVSLGATREFRFEGVAAGRHRIAIHAGDRWFLRIVHLTVTDADVGGVVLREREGDCAVTVTVDGLQTGEASVRPKAGTSGAIRMFDFDGGRFTIDGLAAGTHRIRVGDGRGRPVEREVELRPGAKGALSIPFGR